MRTKLVAAFGAGAVVAGLVAGGVAMAQGDDTTYTGCVVPPYGLLALVAEGDEPQVPCGEGQTEMSWNQQGVPGAVGPQGPAGAPGSSPSGRAIEVALDSPRTGTFSHLPAVATADCANLTAQIEVNGGPAPAVHFSTAVPGVPGFFGSTDTDVSATNFIPDRYSAWVAADQTGPEGGGWEVGAETVVTIVSATAGQEFSVWLYCIPRS